MEKAVSFDQLENSMERVSECINAISGATDMTGATASAAGTHGLVPQPMAGDNVKFLTGAGTFTTPVLAQISDMSAFMRTLNTQTDAQNVRSAIGASSTSEATTSAAGLMSASDKTKLNGIASGANAYSLPAATASVLGGVKIGSNITNSSGTISLTKDNVTNALGYTPPTTNTTYGEATTSTAGLMSAADKTKLNGIATGANNYSLPAATASVLGGVKIGSNISVSSGTISLSGTNIINALGYTPDYVVAKSMSVNNASNYIKYSSGLIIQWGYVTLSASSQTISFPITFPNICIPVVTYNDDAHANQLAAPVIQWSSSSLTIYGFATAAICWHAIGF